MLRTNTNFIFILSKKKYAFARWLILYLPTKITLYNVSINLCQYSCKFAFWNDHNRSFNLRSFSVSNMYFLNLVFDLGKRNSYSTVNPLYKQLMWTNSKKKKSYREKVVFIEKRTTVRTMYCCLFWIFKIKISAYQVVAYKNYWF